MDVLKNFPSETVTMLRSQIHPADYNPRQISAEGRKNLKRSIKKFGVVGGIVVNKQTGYTIVGGHQKVYILDEINKYPDNDYELKVEVVDVDLKTEKTMNIALNNSNVGGQWQYDMLAALVPDIDYKEAGLSDADLSMIGLDYMYQTEEQVGVADELGDLMVGVEAQHQAEVQQRAEERAAIREASKEAEAIAQQEMEREAKVQHMKDVKQQVKEQAIQNAQNMDAYLVLSFTDFKAKATFCQRFGYDPMQRMIKGEDFDARCEVAYDEDFEDDEE